MPPNTPNARVTLDEEPETCAKCNLTFSSFADYHRHKLKSRRHITCEVCSLDFESHEGCKQHHDQMHAHEQSLNCPGCGMHFTRVGGLMAHIELAECHGFSEEQLKKARMAKADWYNNYHNARNFRDYGRTAGEFSNQSPMPFKPNAIVASDAGGVLGGAGETPDVQDPVASPIFEDDNILAFDDPSEALNLPWGEKVAPTAAFTNDFPALNTKPQNVMDAPAVEMRAGTAWATKQKLFADAPAAIAPPTELLKSLTVKEDDDEDPLDPTSRIFNANKYYIVHTHKFKCPHRGCTKSSPTEAAFIQHLKSPAHRNEKLQCINCLRYFATATALTQHCESQGVRCKVRETQGYDGVVDGVTGGTAVTAGRHVDDTVKYAINPALLRSMTQGATGFIEAHKNAATEKEKQFNTHWDNHEPKW